MSVLDKIKGLLADIKVRVGNIASENKFTLIHYEDKRGQILVVNSDGNTGLNLAALPKATDKAIGKIIHESEKGTLIVDEESSRLLKEVDESRKKPDNDELLKFFYGKIPQEDFLILTSSIFIRDKFKEGKNKEVAHLRQQLAQTYGQKAYIISNLCTANYFENFLLPLYKDMSSKKSFDLGQYTEAYKKLIKYFPVAFFINIFMTKKKVEEEIRNKIIENKKYSIPYLNIHGIGRDNIKTIQIVISKLQEGRDYTMKKIELDETIIIVRLRFD